MKHVMFTACAVMSLCGYRTYDFHEHLSPCILETKQIEIPGFPGAFNGSIVRWQDRLLLVFRVRDAQMISTFQMAAVWLDDDFNPQGEAQILEVHNDSSGYAIYQDPRLLVVHDRLYIFFSNMVNIQGAVVRRMFVGHIVQESDRLSVESPICLELLDGACTQREKNWAPFEYNGTVLLAYSVDPHKIVQPLLTGLCELIGETTASSGWNWGELRGGTPAVRIGDEYLAFFHSSKPVVTAQSGGKRMQHYVMGAYTFSAEPPFKITRISPEPLAGEGFYEPPYHATWKPLRVVFPMGCIVDGEHIWVTYGRQDFEIWVAKIDAQALLDSLQSAS